MSAPVSPERVLPTLNADGTRFRIRPRLYAGRLFRARRVVAYLLVALFVSIPFLTLNGKPLILLDIIGRRFTLFGRTFLPTDGVLLMLLMLSIFVTIFWITALVGRAWCGWACPQTVYMEFLFRPIERLFEGPREEQLRLDRQGLSLRRLAKNGTFLLLSFLLGNVFLSYFVGVQALAQWMRRSPFEHPSPFLVVALTTGLVFFDFAYFREQMCTVICPYARLQSVLLDKRSLIIGYDARRGEPRSKGKPRPAKAGGDTPQYGDCIDCRACVVTCPTGIDIRQGLQLECIACGQCADACDSIMHKLKRPLGLIRYASQKSLESAERTPILRPRVLIYSALLLGLTGALAFAASEQRVAEVTILRGLGAPFFFEGDAISNQIRIKVENRGERPEHYAIELRGAPGASLVAPENPLDVAPGTHRTTSVFVLAPRSLFVAGEHRVQFHVSNGRDFTGDFPYRLLGPSDPTKGQ